MGIEDLLFLAINNQEKEKTTELNKQTIQKTPEIILTAIRKAAQNNQPLNAQQMDCVNRYSHYLWGYKGGNLVTELIYILEHFPHVLLEYKSVVVNLFPEFIPMMSFQLQEENNEFDLYSHTYEALYHYWQNADGHCDWNTSWAILFHDIAKPFNYVPLYKHENNHTHCYIKASPDCTWLANCTAREAAERIGLILDMAPWYLIYQDTRFHSQEIQSMLQFIPKDKMVNMLHFVLAEKQAHGKHYNPAKENNMLLKQLTACFKWSETIGA